MEYSPPQHSRHGRAGQKASGLCRPPNEGGKIIAPRVSSRELAVARARRDAHKHWPRPHAPNPVDFCVRDDGHGTSSE